MVLIRNKKKNLKKRGVQFNLFCSEILYCIVYVYPPFTKKRIVLLYFGRDVRTCLGVAIFEVSMAPVFHIKMGASR